MRPLALNFAIDRKEDFSIPYEYDYFESLSTIEINGSKIPFIDSDTLDVSLLTKTKVNQEREDEHSYQLELTTKTERSRERDDHHSSLLFFQTKTFTAKERDDQ